MDQLYVICLDGCGARSQFLKYPAQARTDDLWSPKNYARLAKWRLLHLKARAATFAKGKWVAH
ncbi:MAG TPA: hypothetical protein VJR23_17725 [Candidatus Acidoferrales bacterium]|nr:hypothetical protein [Candidatus Acidoferrales bacterium]